MSRRALIFLLVLALTAPAVNAKNKKKQSLPEYVLRARSVVVMVRPDAGEPLTNPTANRTARESVEKAMMEWGKYDVQMDTQTADLIIAVRKGYAGGPAINNSPADNRPVIVQPGDTNTRVGMQRGTPTPDLTSARPNGAPSHGPQIANQAGPPDDMFEVYRGGVNDPLDSSPVWRYTAKDALNGPDVTAVDQFRKAVEESEKSSQQKP